MNKWIFGLLFFLSFTTSNAQVTTDSIKDKELANEENDTIIGEPILLQEVIVYRQHLTDEEIKQFELLQKRVYTVYPYAKIAADRLTMMNKNMSKIKDARGKKKYFKIVEDYMENEFKAKLKKLSRKQGQILVKLIARQTGFTTYDLIKDYKSGWKAFWSNNTAKLFDIDLKANYLPYEVNEDYLIESILDKAFNRGRLVRQEAANPIDIDELSDYWEEKAMAKK